MRDEAHRRRPIALRADAPENVADPIGKPWDPRWLQLGEVLDGLIERITRRAHG